MTFKGPRCQNTWTDAPARQCPHLGPPLRSLHSWMVGGAGLLGVTLTLGQTPMGPSPGAWRLNAGDWGPPSPSAGLTHPYPVATGAARVAAILSGRENGQSPLSPWRPSKATSAKEVGPTLLLTSALTSACPSTQRTAGGSGVPASWGLTLTLGRPSRGTYQGACGRNTRNWGPRAPVPDSPCHPATTRAAKGAAGHSGQENGQSPPNTRQLSKATHTKTLGPMLPLASTLTSAHPSAHSTPGG